MSLFFYQIGIKILSTSLKTLAFFGHKKAKKSVLGKEKWMKDLSEFDNQKKTIWIHAASHGEAIMAIPLMKQVLAIENTQLIMSFFSPSGYENFNYNDNNYIKIYLPFDSKKNSKKIIQFIKPKILIFVKYDLWLNLIHECNKKNIPTLVFSSKFRADQWYFKIYGRSAKNILKTINCILTIDHLSERILKENGFENVKYSGDTRYDQVSENIPNLKLIKKYPCIILGSSWKDEEVIAAQNIREINNISWIIAPHEIDQKKVLKIKELFGKDSVLFSELDVEKPLPEILIIDKIGVLAELYFYSDIAFIGGGFSGKLHNILEAASKGNFILFGPKIKNYPEAYLMLKEEVSQVVEDKESFKKIILELISNPKKLKKKQERAIELIKENRGATNKVWNEIEKLI